MIGRKIKTAKGRVLRGHLGGGGEMNNAWHKQAERGIRTSMGYMEQKGCQRVSVPSHACCRAL